MKICRRASLFAVLLTVAILVCLAGSRAVFCSGLPGAATARLTAAQQFYTRVLGQWVGTTVSRLDAAKPVTGSFHLLITRVDANTFREEYTFYRRHPKTGVVERVGTQSDLSTIASNGVIHRTCRGSGTVLIKFKPKKAVLRGQRHGPRHRSRPPGGGGQGEDRGGRHALEPGEERQAAEGDGDLDAGRGQADRSDPSRDELPRLVLHPALPDRDPAPRPTKGQRADRRQPGADSLVRRGSSGATVNTARGFPW